MICIRAEIPPEICDIDDELKAIYHDKDSLCIWVFNSRDDRNRFVDKTVGMLTHERERHFDKFFAN